MKTMQNILAIALIISSVSVASASDTKIIVTRQMIKGALAKAIYEASSLKPTHVATRDGSRMSSKLLVADDAFLNCIEAGESDYYCVLQVGDLRNILPVGVLMRGSSEAYDEILL